MRGKPSNFVAYTTNPNTPESDKQDFVFHTVRYTLNGEQKEAVLLARCPLDAIDTVKRRFGW